MYPSFPSNGSRRGKGIAVYSAEVTVTLNGQGEATVSPLMGVAKERLIWMLCATGILRKRRECKELRRNSRLIGMTKQTIMQCRNCRCGNCEHLNPPDKSSF